ncbi:hypothetical protein ABMA70_11240 [Halobacteriovorax sp. XZX-3]
MYAVAQRFSPVRHFFRFREGLEKLKSASGVFLKAEQKILRLANLVSY